MMEGWTNLAETIKRLFQNRLDLSVFAAEMICDRSKDSIRDKGFFTLVLTGGRSPVGVYEKLSSDYADEIDWKNTHLFWGDERLVPSDHDDSNFRLACDSMISKLDIPSENLHPVPVQMCDGGVIAHEYEGDVRGFFHDRRMDSPQFDLTLLGLGPDGHVASLFPGSPVLDEREALVGFVEKPGLSPLHPRITLTLPAINSSRQVMFLVTGDGKERIVEEVLEGNSDHPASRVTAREKVYWFIS